MDGGEPADPGRPAAAGHGRRGAAPRVEFKSGTYDYYNVPERVHRALMSASSKGTYHARHVKWRYRYERAG
ncbi:MAG: KTSC domain-containing protein [Thaumarchaeota archaeon]|nr:KTSC domain-containing protein [Nitrososphaerota archaeon]